MFINPKTPLKHTEMAETPQNINRYVSMVFLVLGGVPERNILGFFGRHGTKLTTLPSLLSQATLNSCFHFSIFSYFQFFFFLSQLLNNFNKIYYAWMGSNIRKRYFFFIGLNTVLVLNLWHLCQISL